MFFPTVLFLLQTAGYLPALPGKHFVQKIVHSARKHAGFPPVPILLLSFPIFLLPLHTLYSLPQAAFYLHQVLYFYDDLLIKVCHLCL